MRRSRPSKECSGMSALDKDWFESCYKRDNNTKIISLLDDKGINISPTHSPTHSLTHLRYQYQY